MLAQYYNLCRFGRQGYREIITAMEHNARYLGDQLRDGGRFELVGEAPQLPLACFRLADRERLPYDEFDIAAGLAGERGWMVPAYSLPPDAEEEVVMRALVKENVSHSAARTLNADLAKVCDALDKRGGSLPDEVRRRAKTNVGF